MMKITKRQLRRLIREAAGPQVAELTDPSVTEQQVSAAWPEGVMYNGAKVFDTFYSNTAMSAQRSFVEREGYDDSQEAYLGYDPTNDVFVMGFDVWANEYDEYGYSLGGGEMEGLVIELRSDGSPMDVVGSFPGGMYPAGLRGIKQSFPGIIDVRLD
jgi:hypothetical protein